MSPNVKINQDLTLDRRTTLHGFLTASPKFLISKLGIPLRLQSQNGEVFIKWILQFWDGTVATIYSSDFKNDVFYKDCRWSVGGKGINVGYKISNFLNIEIENC